jgi:alanyl-tRNA synthetase
VVEFSGLSEDGRGLIVCDYTPVHPESFRWPDQPGDTGAVSWGHGEHPLLEALTGLANRRTGELRIGDAAKALGRTDEDWVGVVVHVVDAISDLPSPGTRLNISVDRLRRQQLSAAHTAAHLSAFALNRSLVGYWIKQDIALDTLGAPDFDKQALVSSRIDLAGCTDRYRLGKTLRRKGFDAAKAITDLPSIVVGVNDVLAKWLGDPTPVVLEPLDSTLDTRRTWRCRLGGQVAEMFCAGTHADHLNALISVEVHLSSTDDELTMRTVVKPTPTNQNK